MGTMARSMRLLLVRHGETVDNVAKLYAGTRDSALTNHGHQQATRLGLHLKSLGLAFTHIFSSQLQRAATTASLIREPQLARETDVVPEVVQLPILMEQDFGSLEGKKWHEQPPRHAGSTFVDVETKESMAQRADTFINGHLLPLVTSPSDTNDPVVAVVSHGILLSVLWKRLLLRLPTKSVTVAPELSANAPVTLERLGGWSNTGYLELHMELASALEETVGAKDVSPPVAPKTLSARPDKPALSPGVDRADAPLVVAADQGIERDSPGIPPSPIINPQPESIRLPSGWTTLILTINGKDHLRGLKRTGGGVGSSKHETSQKNIEGFFKRRKVE